MAHRNFDYWDERAAGNYILNGELFYTVTPIPFYVTRRSIVLGLLKSQLINPPQSCKQILDFGCGDGWFLEALSSTLKHQFTGYDISRQMIRQARNRQLKGVELKLIDDNEDLGKQNFDVIYAITVFAHILEQRDCVKILKGLSNSLPENGHLILFEQTGRIEQKGETWIKRRFADYKEITEQAGLEILEHQHVSFRPHRFFEKRIAPLIYYCMNIINGRRGNVKLRANGSSIYRAISRFFLMLTNNPFHHAPDEVDGYTFIVLAPIRRINKSNKNNLDKAEHSAPETRS